MSLEDLVHVCILKLTWEVKSLSLRECFCMKFSVMAPGCISTSSPVLDNG